MEVVSNRSFTLTTGNGKRSRLRRLKNGVPQGSVLAPLLFNIYTSNLSTTISRKYAYADDLATMHARWRLTGSGRGTDQGHGKFLQTWKLKLYTAKTVSAAFHLNKEANLELKVNYKLELKVNFAE